MECLCNLRIPVIRRFQNRWRRPPLPAPLEDPPRRTTSPTPPTPVPGGRLATFGWPPPCCADTPMRLLTPCVDNFLHLMPETHNCYELMPH